MATVLFYHMSGSGLDRTLAMLLGKATEQGLRALVRTRDADRADWIDQRLWLGADDGFLPHGLEGGPHDARQPVLIGCGALPEGVACLMAVDGAEVAPGEAAALEKCCILFDGADPAAVEGARAQWKALTGEGLAAAYWSEEGGRWQKKAVTGGRTEAGA